ncbi:sugar MFS transporter [Pedobacter sp.]|jgi:FHS family L-fucose permease-like MFS transporter|uniref:sugar MFS transporter n=1 Tax=Pedobacter sp. TaxID=1411316 RepID=UPI002C655BFC|nr:sugar MFS transporter [Pedobacter sp.]HWW40400.1 sugar MFS transporter [Pedobacter sp.]
MKKNPVVLGLILLTFFVISFLTNIIGPLVPDIIKSFKLNLTTVALLPFAFFIAYGVMSIPSGMLVEKYGEKRVMAGAFFIAFLGALIFVLAPGYFSYMFSLFFIGAGMAMLQVAINPLLRVAGGEEHFAFNSVLGQFFFGLASFLSPLVYSYLVTNIGKPVHNSNTVISFFESIVPANLPWISLYWIFAILSVAMVVVIAIVKIPKVELKGDEKVGGLKTNIELLKNPTVLLYFLAIFCYVGIEQGVANWMSEFLHAYHGIDPKTGGATAVSWFWGLLTVGTILGLILLKFIDSRKVLVLFTGAAIICLLLALFGSAEIAIWAFPMVGFFASVMWSIIISLALNSMSEHHGAVSGILITGICGGAIIPLIVGWIGDLSTLKTGMLFLFIMLSYIFSLGFWSRPLVQNEVISFKKFRKSKAHA